MTQHWMHQYWSEWLALDAAIGEAQARLLLTENATDIEYAMHAMSTTITHLHSLGQPSVRVVRQQLERKPSNVSLTSRLTRA
jgi:hypothetical protein